MGYAAIGAIVSAVIGAGASVYSSNMADKAAKAERDRLAKAEEERKKELERIAKETRPEGEALQSVTFGTDANNKKVGSTQEFIVTKSAAALGGTSSGSGLGFSV